MSWMYCFSVTGAGSVVYNLDGSRNSVRILARRGACAGHSVPTGGCGREIEPGQRLPEDLLQLYEPSVGVSRCCCLLHAPAGDAAKQTGRSTRAQPLRSVDTLRGGVGAVQGCSPGARRDTPGLPGCCRLVRCLGGRHRLKAVPSGSTAVPAVVNCGGRISRHRNHQQNHRASSLRFSQ